MKSLLVSLVFFICFSLSHSVDENLLINQIKKCSAEVRMKQLEVCRRFGREQNAKLKECMKLPGKLPETFKKFPVSLTAIKSDTNSISPTQRIVMTLNKCDERENECLGGALREVSTEITRSTSN